MHKKTVAVFISSLVALTVVLTLIVWQQVKTDKEIGLSTERAENSIQNNISSSAAIPDDNQKDFSLKVDEFIRNSGYKKDNYIVSPTSFRAALTLAISGAEGETKEKLLDVAGFEDIPQMNMWYSGIVKSIKEFDDNTNKQEGAEFDIQNSVWKNTDYDGEISLQYAEHVHDKYDAVVDKASKIEITDKINEWINIKTNGFISQIADDMSKQDITLINVLYLKTAWRDSFNENSTFVDSFKTVDGDKVTKEFMNKQDKYRYYESIGSKMIVIPMYGGIDAVFILGSMDNALDKLDKCESKEVIVKLPKFEIESTFNHQELVDFCKENGADIAFNPNLADFSSMCEKDHYISDIVQKSRIKTDEDGIEAAAVTEIAMNESEACIGEEPEEPKEFIADKPFRFMILTREDNPEVLFCGQIVK